MAGTYPDNLFSQVNYITDLWQDPCDAPWTVYVETAFPHALELFVNVATFGGLDLYSQFTGFMEEVVEGVADPGGPNLSRRGLRGARKGRFRNPLMDLPDRVANRSIFSEVLRPLTDNTAGRSFFFLYNFADRAMFQWFIANKAREEFIDWTTALYQTQHCSQAARPRVGAFHQGAGSIPISGWIPTYLGGPDYAENGADMVNGIPDLNGEGGRIIASNTLRDDRDPYDYWLRLWSPLNGEIARTATRCAPGQDCTLHISGRIEPGDTVQPEVLCDGAVTVAVSGFTKASAANAAAGQQLENDWFGKLF